MSGKIKRPLYPEPGLKRDGIMRNEDVIELHRRLARITDDVLHCMRSAWKDRTIHVEDPDRRASIWRSSVGVVEDTWGETHYDALCKHAAQAWPDMEPMLGVALAHMVRERYTRDLEKHKCRFIVHPLRIKSFMQRFFPVLATSAYVISGEYFDSTTSRNGAVEEALRSALHGACDDLVKRVSRPRPKAVHTSARHDIREKDDETQSIFVVRADGRASEVDANGKRRASPKDASKLQEDPDLDDSVSQRAARRERDALALEAQMVRALHTQHHEQQEAEARRTQEATNSTRRPPFDHGSKEDGQKHDVKAQLDLSRQLDSKATQDVPSDDKKQAAGEEPRQVLHYQTPPSSRPATQAHGESGDKASCVHTVSSKQQALTNAPEGQAGAEVKPQAALSQSTKQSGPLEQWQPQQHQTQPKSQQQVQHHTHPQQQSVEQPRQQKQQPHLSRVCPLSDETKCSLAPSSWGTQNDRSLERKQDQTIPIAAVASNGPGKADGREKPQSLLSNTSLPSLENLQTALNQLGKTKESGADGQQTQARHGATRPSAWEEQHGVRDNGTSHCVHASMQPRSGFGVLEKGNAALDTEANTGQWHSQSQSKATEPEPAQRPERKASPEVKKIRLRASSGLREGPSVQGVNTQTSNAGAGPSARNAFKMSFGDHSDEDQPTELPNMAWHRSMLNARNTAALSTHSLQRSHLFGPNSGPVHAGSGAMFGGWDDATDASDNGSNW